jgi:CubicO group peptidase (beta-lactamase class C family)
VTEAELLDLLREHSRAHGVPGAAAGILAGGAVTVACHGAADARTGDPVTTASRFGVGSLTKSMCATAIVRLADAGQLSLEDPVAGHVPELRGAAWAEAATVRDLLANRSGLPLRARLEFGFDEHETGADDVLARFAAAVAAQEPTAVAWSYTNAGWCLAGRVVETVTGRMWEDAMREQLLDPAGMTETEFASDPRSPHRVTGHEPAGKGLAPVEPLVARAFAPAGTSLASTMGDLLRFGALHLREPALAAMRAPQPSPAIHGWFDGWCLGWARFDADGGPAWGWDSVLPGERAALRILPEHDAAVAVMANSERGRALCRPVLEEILASFGVGLPPLRLDPDPGPAGGLERFAGVYGWPDSRVEVRAAGTHLAVSSDDGDAEAWPLDGRAFVADAADPDNPAITFGELDAAGRPGAVYLMLWAYPRIEG